MRSGKGQRVRVDFVDGNCVWSETGRLRRASLGPYGGPYRVGFVLDSDDGGDRVFPLLFRQAEVWRTGEDKPCVVTCDNEVLFDEFDGACAEFNIDIEEVRHD